MKKIIITLIIIITIILCFGQTNNYLHDNIHTTYFDNYGFPVGTSITDINYFNQITTTFYNSYGFQQGKSITPIYSDIYYNPIQPITPIQPLRLNNNFPIVFDNNPFQHLKNFP